MELHDSSADNTAFSSALDAARTVDSQNGWAVTPKSPEELTQAGTKSYMDQNGSTGFAIAPDGDIEAVFANKAAGAPKGATKSTIPQAIALGGNKLDCYGDGLVSLYTRYGFEPVARVQFNAEYANPGWTADKGSPDIYFMVHNGDSADTVVQKMGTYKTWTNAELEALPVMEYDDAYAYRDAILNRRKGKAITVDDVMPRLDGEADFAEQSLRWMLEGAEREHAPVQKTGAESTKTKPKISMADFTNRQSEVFNNLEYDDTDTQTQIMQQAHAEMVRDGRIVQIPEETTDRTAEYYPDLRTVKKKDRTPILKQKMTELKTELRRFLNDLKGVNYEFEINGNILDAKLYDAGVREVMEKVTQDKASMLRHSDEVFRKAQYLYSTPDYDGDFNVYRWNYFYTPVQIGDETVGVRIAVRDMANPQESQIYNWNIKKNATLGGEGRGENRIPNDASSAAFDSSISADRKKVKREIIVDDVMPRLDGEADFAEQSLRWMLEGAEGENAPVQKTGAESTRTNPKISMADFTNRQSEVFNNLEYDDTDTQTQIMQRTHAEMVRDGRIVQIPEETTDRTAEYYPDLRTVKKKDRTPILKQKITELKTELRRFLNGLKGANYEFDVNGNILDAKLYDTGVQEVMEKVTQNKADMLFHSDEIFKNAQYLYSTPDYDGNSNVYRWNYFYTPVQIGDETVGVRIAIRDMVSGQDGKPESQIYNWGIKKDATLDGGKLGKNAASPHVSSDASNTSIRSDSQNVNREITVDDVMARLDGEKEFAEKSLRWMLEGAERENAPVQKTGAESTSVNTDPSTHTAREQAIIMKRAGGGTQASDANRPGNTPNTSLASDPSANSSIRGQKRSVNREITVDDVMPRLDREAEFAEQSLRWMLEGAERESAPVQKTGAENTQGNSGIVPFSTQEASNLSSQKGIVNGHGMTFREFVNNVKSFGNTVRFYFGKVSDTLGSRISDATGQNVSGYNIAIRSDEVAHAMSKHGNASIEAGRGQLPVTVDVMEQLPEVFNHPDEIVLQNKKDYAGRTAFEVRKQLNGYTVAVVGISKGKHSIEVDTVYVINKKGSPATVDATQNVSPDPTLKTSSRRTLDTEPSARTSVPGNPAVQPIHAIDDPNTSIRADTQNVNREITVDDVMARLDGEAEFAEQSLRWMLEGAEGENAPVQKTGAESTRTNPKISMADFTNRQSEVFNNLEYDDIDTQTQIMQQTHAEMVRDGRIVQIPEETTDRTAEYYPDLRTVKKKDRTPILKQKMTELKTELRRFLDGLKGVNYEFEVNGNILDAKLYDAGVREVMEKVTQDKASMLQHSDEVFRKAQYLYSTPDYDGDFNVYRWNYFYTPVQIGDETVGVRIAVRDMAKTNESQIYNWNIKKNATLGGGGGGNTASHTGASSAAFDSSISADRKKVKREIIVDDVMPRLDGEADFAEQSLRWMLEGAEREYAPVQKTGAESTSVNTDPSKHTQVEQRVIEEYQNSVDNGLVYLAQQIQDGNVDVSKVRYTLNPVSDRAALDIQRITGVDTSGFSTVIEGRMLEHTIKRHGEHGTANKSMRDLNDIGRMQYVIDNYDSVSDGGTTKAYTTNKPNGKSGLARTVIFEKAVNGTYYAIEAVPDTKAKTTYVVSAYMSKKRS